MNAFIFSNTVVDVGRKPLPRRKVEEVKRLLREGRSCREVSRMTGVSLGKVGEIRKSVKTATSKEVGRSRDSLSDLERELSKIEHRLSRVEGMLNDLYSALEKVLPSIGTPATPQPPTLAAGGTGEKKDVVEEFEAALKDFELKRARVKEMLERLGLRVEDVYMKKDEVEKMVEEVRRKAAEEALDDKRIEAVENIVRDAVARLIELFKPVVQAFLTVLEKASGSGESGERKEQDGLEDRELDIYA